MKTLLILACALTSLQSFAFTTVTLQKEAKLANERQQSLYGLLMDGKGGDYCYITFTSTNNADTQIVPVGTKFEVNSSELTNSCGRDWGRKCVVSFTARNHEQNVDLYVMCKDNGMFAKKLTVDKVNKIAKDTILVR